MNVSIAHTRVHPWPEGYRRCRCGCSLQEHRMTVSEDWVWCPAECLTCSECEQFELINEEE